MGTKLLRFDVIIGNPPYQQMDDGHGASAIPLYNLFIEQAKRMKPKYLTMIIPSRWFSGGKGLLRFRQRMLEEGGIREIHDFPIPSEIFPSVDVKGGINYFLWDRDYKDRDVLVRTYYGGKCTSEMRRPLKEEGVDIFIRDNMAPAILEKVRKLKEDSFKPLINSRDSFDIPSNFVGENEPFDGSLTMYGYKSVSYIPREKIKLGKYLIDAHKLFIGKAYGGDNKGRAVGVPFYGGDGTCCTETYYVLGPFKTKEICDNVASYINTNFFQYMVKIKKIAQNTTGKTYEFVPIQDFNKPWTDEELYDKYGISQEEIEHIEDMVGNKNK